MAPWKVVFGPFAALLLPLAFIVSAGGMSGSGRIESDGIYVLAPEIDDCPTDTNCSTLASLSAKNTTDLYDIIFLFLPGIHKLSRTWNIANSGNITLLSVDSSVKDDDGAKDEVVIACESDFRGAKILQVSESENVFFHGINLAYCENTCAALYLDSSREISLLDFRVICNTDAYMRGNCTHYDVYAANSENVTIVNSTFHSCQSGMGFAEVQSVIIDHVSFFWNRSCDIEDDIRTHALAGNDSRDILIQHSAISTHCYGIRLVNCHHAVFADVGFLNNYIIALGAEDLQGNVTFKRISVQGSSYGLILLGVFHNVNITIAFLSVDNFF